jgi:signal transduction histidine kinase
MVRTDLASDPQPVVHGDPTQRQQVLLNLIINATDAMSADAAKRHELRIASSVKDTSVIVTVEDTGTGIAPDKIGSIFDAFVTTKPGGMGLGLSICKSIVESHGGQILATSVAGSGSVFRIVLPLAGSQ